MPAKKDEFVKVKKILIFRLCCFGDVIKLTPAIGALKEKFPDAKITIAAASWIKKLLPYLKHVDNAIIFDGPFEKSFRNRAAKTIAFISTLRNEKFDLVLLAHRNSIFGRILKLSGIRYRLGFAATNFLTHTVNYDYKKHFTERHLDILTAHGIPVKNKEIKLSGKPNKNSVLKKYGIHAPALTIGIFPFGGSNPGTQMDIKRWDYDNYLRLIRKISDKYDDAIILFFEGVLENEKSRKHTLPDNVRKVQINFELISVCDIFISADTGPLYVAEAFGVSTLSLFGPTSPYDYAPLNNSKTSIHRFIWKKPVCSPCHTSFTAIQRENRKYWKENLFICHTGTHECMTAITVEEVKNVLDEMISEVTALKKN